MTFVVCYDNALSFAYIYTTLQLTTVGKTTTVPDSATKQETENAYDYQYDHGYYYVIFHVTRDSSTFATTA